MSSFENIETILERFLREVYKNRTSQNSVKVISEKLLMEINSKNPFPPESVPSPRNREDYMPEFNAWQAVLKRGIKPTLSKCVGKTFLSLAFPTLKDAEWVKKIDEVPKEDIADFLAEFGKYISKLARKPPEPTFPTMKYPPIFNPMGLQRPRSVPVQINPALNLKRKLDQFGGMGPVQLQPPPKIQRLHPPGQGQGNFTPGNVSVTNLPERGKFFYPQLPPNDGELKSFQFALPPNSFFPPGFNQQLMENISKIKKNRGPQSPLSPGRRRVVGNQPQVALKPIPIPRVAPKKKAPKKGERKRRVLTVNQVVFKVYNNHSNTPVKELEILCSVKNVYSDMLPNMPKDYTTRLVFDRRHYSLVGSLKKNVICGITFRPFLEQGFIEVAFVAVRSTFQIKGIGTKMMNHLKDYCQKARLFRMLTCADNHAVGYFQKQGFSLNVTLPKSRYDKFIKSYDSVKLMECVIRPGVDYINSREMIANQKQQIMEVLGRSAEGKKVYDGMECFKKGRKPRSIIDIPGMREAGWIPPVFDRDLIKEKLLQIVKYMTKVPQAWPFLHPVDGNEVQDYYEIITDPMDLETLGENCKRNMYSKNVQGFHDAMMKIFVNCKIYNKKGSQYYKCGQDCEKTYKEYINRDSINLYLYF